ncbi:MAG: hypothetical protein KDD73_08630 [Anaerolineales bacterium]|nr:hypothetical protein [Anaerolineales bacterium]MCB9126786.1 hypothetical protein [Ardenticatenales bacterium]MCB9172645.1 hypothetical protein [Ardenticatenales bacterium]
MDSLFSLLLNVVYGLLFATAFVVMVGTVVLFAMATWEKAIKPLRQRGPSAPRDGAPK